MLGWLVDPQARELTTAARWLTLILLVPVLVFVGYEVYGRLTWRWTMRRFFGNCLALVRDGTVHVSANAENSGAGDALSMASREAVMMDASLLGDVRVDWDGKLSYFTRCLTVDAGRVLVCCSVMPWPRLIRFWLWARGRAREARPCDLCSVLADGKYIRTSDTTVYPDYDPSLIRQTYCVQGETLAQMLAVHRGAVAAELTENPAADVLQVESLDDAVGVAKRFHAAVAESFRRRGLVSEQRTAEICASLSPRMAKAFREELLAARERSGLHPAPKPLGQAEYFGGTPRS